METFTKLFGSVLLFVYHCFDRVVLNGYLSGLSRPEKAVYCFRQVMGVPAIVKEVLSQRPVSSVGSRAKAASSTRLLGNEGAMRRAS